MMKIILSPVHSVSEVSLQGRLHICGGAWRCCNPLKGNDHSAELRLGFGFLSRSTSYIPVVVALHSHKRTLNPVQLRILG